MLFGRSFVRSLFMLINTRSRRCAHSVGFVLVQASVKRSSGQNESFFASFIASLQEDLV